MGLFKGQAFIDDSMGNYITYKHFRIGARAKRKAVLMKMIEDAKKELEEIEEAKV